MIVAAVPTFDDVIARLEGVQTRGPKNAMAICPCHPDVNPSLSVKEGDDGRVLLHCFGCGADYETVLKAISLGGSGNGHVPPVRVNGKAAGEEGRPSAIYEYDDERGNPVFRKLRFANKNFRVQHANSRGGWQTGLGGARPVLYGLPALVNPTREWEPVWFCEGEKDADRLRSLELLATTNHEGALRKPLTDERAAALRGRVVYCLADNDEPGRRHAETVAASIRGIAQTVKIVELEGLPAGGDVSDWLDAGHTREELERVALLSPAWEPDEKPAPALLKLSPTPLAELLTADIEPLEWLVDGLIARGQLVMLAGRPKSGKSWFSLALAQAIDSGRLFLDRETRRGRVLMVILEDGPRRLRRRLELLGWKPARVDKLFDLAHLDGDGINPGPGLRQLDEIAGGYDLIVFDTLIAGLSGRADENSNTAMAAIANEFAAIARRSNAAIILVHHTSKGTHEDVFHTIRGASALRGAYDVGMVLERKKEEREALLHVESKDAEEGSYTIRQGDGGAGWQLLGSGVELGNIRAGRKVVEALKNEGDGVTADELAKTLGITRQAAGQQLRAAEAAGVVRRERQQGAQGRLLEGGDGPPRREADLWFLV